MHLLRVALGQLAVVAFFLAAGVASAQPGPVAPDLAGIPGEHGWKLVNRSAVVIDKDGATAVRLEGEGGTGLIKLENVTFGDGAIEFDARGKNEVQRSFLGVAFHGADVGTYDAVYFRPFNFRSADAARRLHAVQYVAEPAYPWDRLRSEHPGAYEKPIVPAPDPEGWFHVRIVVAAPEVSVYVNRAAEPSLVVTQLSDRRRGWIALWVSVSGGDFANLTITPAAPAGQTNLGAQRAGQATAPGRCAAGDGDRSFPFLVLGPILNLFCPIGLPRFLFD